MTTQSNAKSASSTLTIGNMVEIIKTKQKGEIVVESNDAAEGKGNLTFGVRINTVSGMNLWDLRFYYPDELRKINTKKGEKNKDA